MTEGPGGTGVEYLELEGDKVVRREVIEPPTSKNAALHAAKVAFVRRVWMGKDK